MPPFPVWPRKLARKHANGGRASTIRCGGSAATRIVSQAGRITGTTGLCAAGVAVSRKLWQSAVVRKRLFKRGFVILGMVAMLAALVYVPLSTASALAIASAPHMQASTGEMPCHKQAKHCPDCPQKFCLDMAACLAKCFQSFSAPVLEETARTLVASVRLRPALSRAPATSFIPPLLRPPSV
jgi:hypothetical protein